MRSSGLASLIIIFVLALSIFSGRPVLGSSIPTQGLLASINSTYVSVSVNLQVFQNLSALEPSFSLPSFRGALTPQNSSSLSSLVQNAIQTRSPNAKVADLGLSVSSSPLESATQSQWFNVSLNFQVTGVQNTQNGAEKVDMSWKSFAVSRNVTVGNFEINNLGLAYLPTVAAQISVLEPSATSSSSFISYRNFVNSHRVTAVNLPTAVTQVRLFDFSSILATVQNWKLTYGTQPGTVAWLFTTVAKQGVVITESVNEAMQPSTANYLFFYSLQASISAPARSSAQGDTVSVVFDDGVATLMASITVSVVALGTVSFVYERRILGKLTRRKPKR